MAKYIAGIETKEKLMNSAKYLFYEKGFNETSIQDITKEAGIRRSLFFYYFENKIALAEEILSNISDMHFSLIIDEIRKNYKNLSNTYTRCICAASQFRLFLCDKNISKFGSEINSNDVQLNNEFVLQSYQSVIDENPQCLDKSTFEFILIQNISINTLVYHLNATDQLQSSYDEIIYLKIKNILRSLYINEDKIDNMVKEILDIEQKMKFAFEPYFKVIFYN